MAIEHDVSVPGGIGFGSSKTFQVTVADQPDRILFVGWQHATGAGYSRYNDVDMDYVAYVTKDSYVKVRLYKMLNPPVGAHNVFINWGANGSYICGASVFYNVKQNNPFTTPTTASGNSALCTQNHVAATNEVVFDMVGGDSQVTWTMHGSQTLHWKYNGGSGYPVAGGGSSREQGTGGAVTMSWTLGSSRWGSIALALKPVLSGPTARAMFFKRYQDFMDRLRQGLIPQNQLEKEYGLVMSKMGSI